MAGFGSLGGLGGSGGFGMSYPSRGGVAPTSQRVDNPDEMQYLHDKWVEGLQSQSVNQLAGQRAFDAFSRVYGGIADQAGLAPVMSRDAFVSAANNGGKYTANGQTFNLGNWTSPIANQITGAIGGEIGQREEKLKQDLAFMSENGARQQQAYDTMLGTNQINGILSADYANPYFGQVGAQQAGAPTDAGGLDPASLSDIYQPSDTYTAPRTNPRGWAYR